MFNNSDLHNLKAVHPDEWVRAGLLEKDKSGKGFLCPACASGTGTKGTGMRAEVRRGKWFFKCFSCGFYGSILDVIQAQAGMDFPDAVRLAADKLGYQMGTGSTSKPEPVPVSEKPEKAEEFKTFLLQANDTLRAGNQAAEDYLRNRGITPANAATLGIGYDPAGRNIIVPFAGHKGYLMRSIVGDGKYNGKGSRSLPFNAEAIDGSVPVFITEGWADAMSVIEAGCNALSTNSISNTDALLKTLDKKREAEQLIPPLVLAFDNDDKGRNAQSVLASELARRDIFFLQAAEDVFQGCKDLNESLVHDRDRFITVIRAMNAKAAETGQPDQAPAADQIADEKRARELIEAADLAALDAELCEATTGNALDGILEYLGNGGDEVIPTGLPAFDEVIGGGLYPGMYALGGRTGTGKTTLALQIADTIAKTRPVLYVSLEMSMREIVAKSLSRIIYETSRDTASAPHAQNGFVCVPFGDILSGKNFPEVQRAAAYYRQDIGRNFVCLSGLANRTASAIRTAANRLAELRGTAPVVFVDYLQILMPNEDQARAFSDKYAATSEGVLQLKALSIDLNVPVVVLSSFSRAAYGAGTTRGKDGELREPTYKERIAALESAYKDSGTIEYTADMLLGLMNPRNAFDTDGDMSSAVTDVDVYLVKNRRGLNPGHPAALAMIGSAGYFEEREDRKDSDIPESVGRSLY